MSEVNIREGKKTSHVFVSNPALNSEEIFHLTRQGVFSENQHALIRGEFDVIWFSREDRELERSHEQQAEICAEGIIQYLEARRNETIATPPQLSKSSV